MIYPNQTIHNTKYIKGDSCLVIQNNYSAINATSFYMVENNKRDLADKNTVAIFRVKLKTRK